MSEELDEMAAMQEAAHQRAKKLMCDINITILADAMRVETGNHAGWLWVEEKDGTALVTRAHPQAFCPFEGMTPEQVVAELKQRGTVRLRLSWHATVPPGLGKTTKNYTPELLNEALRESV